MKFNQSFVRFGSLSAPENNGVNSYNYPPSQGRGPGGGVMKKQITVTAFCILNFAFSIFLLVWSIAGCDDAKRPDLRISTTRVSLTVGETSKININGGRSPYRISVEPNPSIARTTMDGFTVKVTGVSPGSTSFVIHDNDEYSKTISVTVTRAAPPAPISELERIQNAILDQSARWFADTNPIARMSDTDRLSHLGALIDDLGAGPVPRTLRDLDLPDPSELPASFDWRYSDGIGCVTQVRYQKLCASSWAFASIAALESQAIKAGFSPLEVDDLSEQILISCSQAGGCDGGYIDAAAEFLTQQGTAYETCYPYAAYNGDCENACAWQQQDFIAANGWDFVAAGSVVTVERLKQALYAYGPLVVIFQVFPDFYYYDQGVYSHVWGQCQNSAENCGHAVLLIGWDDAQEAFILKNSWGDTWGESGFFRMAYSETTGNTRFGQWTIAYKGVVEKVESSKATMSDGVEIYYEFKGEGEPLLLIHGMETDHQGNFKGLHSWDPQFAVFGTQYQTIRFDIRGFGQSGPSGDAPLGDIGWSETVHRIAVDVSELMDIMNIQSANIAGVGLGGAVANQVALFYPQKVDQLILAGLREATFPDSASRLADLEAQSHKTAIIVGEDDPQIDAIISEVRENYYTPFLETRVPEAGAWPNADAPEAFNKAALDFLARPVPHTYALNIRLSPASPARLGLGIKARAYFDYVVGNPDGAYIWAKPSAANGGQHHEPSLRLYGKGNASRYFYLDISEVITEIKIIMESPDSEILYQEFLPVNYVWTDEP